jgi:hypothetical protein
MFTRVVTDSNMNSVMRFETRARVQGCFVTCTYLDLPLRPLRTLWFKVLAFDLGFSSPCLRVSVVIFGF